MTIRGGIQKGGPQASNLLWSNRDKQVEKKGRKCQLLSIAKKCHHDLVLEAKKNDEDLQKCLCCSMTSELPGEAALQVNAMMSVAPQVSAAGLITETNECSRTAHLSKQASQQPDKEQRKEQRATKGCN